MVAASPDDGQVRCVQLGDAAVLGHHPGDVRAAEPQEGLPLSVRLSLGRLLDEAGLEDVRRDEGLYVALWRGGVDAWRREQAVRPLAPQALGSHALLVAVHPEGAEVVFGADRLLLTGDGVVLVPTTSSYRLESRGGDLKLVVVVGTRFDESAAPQGSEHAVPLGSDEEAGRDGDEVGQEQPTGKEQQQGQPEVAGEEVDVQAIVAAALTRFTAAASPPPMTEALEKEDQRKRSEEAQVAMERAEEPEFMGTREAQREVGPRGLGVADKAGPKTGEVETCRHWAKGWCMRADACRFAHPQPPVPRGVPQELLLILQAKARVGALSLDRSQGHGRGHGTWLEEAVVKAQGGGLPAVGYAVESGGLTEWEVALPCGMAALLTPFPVVPWRDMVTVQEANLGWVCTWHTHPAGMDPRDWQAKAVMTYVSWSLPAAPGAWASGGTERSAGPGMAVLWRPALTSRASPSQSSRGLSPCISPRWRLALRPRTRRSCCWETERGQGFAWAGGWRFALPASPALWTGTSWKDSSSRGLTGQMCGPPSIAGSQMHGRRCSGPLVTSVWWEWNGAYGPPTAGARR